MSHTEKPEECENCMFGTNELVECDAYARTIGHGPFTPDDQKQWAWLCEVCRSTYAGNAYLYPFSSGYDQPTLATIAWGINRILQAFRETQVTT